MTKREKLLALVAGGMLAIVVLAFLGMNFVRTLRGFEARRNKAEADLHQNELEIAAGQMASEDLELIAQLALPDDREVARWMYSEWLNGILNDEGLARINVLPQNITPYKDIYELHTFKVTGVGDLRKITRLIGRLEAADVAHRIQQMSLRPIRDKKDIDLSMTLEVLAMSIAPVRAELPPPPKDVPKMKPLEEVVLNRNMFSPKNQQPTLDVQTTYTAYVGQPLRIAPAATDPDKDDVKFEADLSSLPNARFSSSANSVEWTPRELGEYQFTIAALDNGIPQRRVEKQVRIEVKQPAAAPVEKLDLTAAKFAYVTGVTSSGGRPEVWVSLRTEGKTLKLGVGDSFKLGNVDASVASIDSQNVEIDAAGRRVRVRLGQSLAESGLQ